jgi:hypothetical protein
MPCGQCDCVDGVSPIPGRWQIDGVGETSECPMRALPTSIWTWFDLFKHYRAGLLWAAGGISDQPAIYLEVMRLIDGAVRKSQKA